jgi:kynureninase
MNQSFTWADSPQVVQYVHRRGPLSRLRAPTIWQASPAGLWLAHAPTPRAVLSTILGLVSPTAWVRIPALLRRALHFSVVAHLPDLAQ